MSVYYDQAIGEEKPGEGGDGLALFIVREILPLCPGTGWNERVSGEVIRALENAASELQAIADYLDKVSGEAQVDTGEAV
jgi:hypothetical protein